MTLGTARNTVGTRAGLLGPLALAGLAARARASGALDIAIGTPPGQPPRAAVTAAADAMLAGRNQYADPAGVPELRAAVAGRLLASSGVGVDPETEITITAGATEGLLVALLTVTDPGDEVVVVEPAFELYRGAVELAGCTRVPAPLDPSGWRLDPERIASVLTPRTAALIVNTPHNPTGRVFTAEELGGLLDLCERRGVTCVVDEVYADFVFDGGPHVSALGFPRHRPRVVVVGSLSKADEMSGWRLGYCVADPALTTALRHVHERTTFGAAVPLQHGAAVLARAGSGPEQFRNGRDEMVRRLAAMGFEVTTPEGGWFLLAGTRRLGLRSDALAEGLLVRAGVLVAPATPFFADTGEGQRWIRTTFVKDLATLTKALDAMESFLAEPDGGVWA
ncbi:pyridoxal phosphate-dependent aminotransferase [Streptomyces clavuligerus]|uniref:Aminotransferase n=1 Tax=Streptomyces clavuligerus TaxID=1901 RepID=B6ICY4_STRCL|nr:pyridoxal phosphate-dependent aminotransferase [Streptomyces clavuligerus]ACJ02372.1 aminotransferase [Streptomyces clavuligerus]ANW22446.1 aminotransferase [Streptomyces clavuligerus]AXU17352.1 pyridoxal phosphate-dependent aminotransferase [Streptomyces clavuligerus]EFG04556.1 Aminotransferase [Streptomyces clavuligerus]MBY6306995.1 pyridoxal phosphate-dependent aminotransferase [Streptomyces clavuligerus]